MADAFRIDLDLIEDHRGYFARTFCVDEFSVHGIDFAPVQCSSSFNVAAYTLRGMHLQRGEEAEHKIVRCSRGAIFDVVIDLRPESATYLAWHGEQLTSTGGEALYVPSGCAHGFLTLEPESKVDYMMSARYESLVSGGVRWDDSAFGVQWPRRPAVISDRDAQFPDYAG